MQQSLSYGSGSGSKTTPKDVFFHLLATITLYMSVFAIILLLFSCINILMPDPLSFYYSGETDAIRIATAMLIVTFPVYAVLMWLINRDITADSGKTTIGARRWLTYLTIFLASIMIIVDIITLLYNFLNGELTLRFFLKVLVVLLVGVVVFGFYIKETKRTGVPVNLKKWVWATSAAVLLSIIAGFLVAGSPWYQRSVRFDEQRVSDLQSIQGETVQFWQQKNKLPATLNELTDTIGGFKAPTDPETKKPYEYKVTGKTSFQLCADFKTESPPPGTASRIYGIAENENWNHSPGRTCYDRTIDPALYKTPTVKPVPR